MHRFDLVDPRTLWKSYLLALTLLFVLITSSHFAAHVFGGDGARAAQDINMSGRQRMLSQRIMYYATLYRKDDYANVEAGEQLQAAVEMFRTSHETLVSEAERALPASVFEIYFAEGGAQLDVDARLFAEAAQTVLSGTDAERQAAFEYMGTVGTSTLLEDLNAAVSAFETNARDEASRAEMWGYAGLALALLALALEATFIFRPAHRTIVKAIDTLEQNNDQLKQQEAEAFAALEDAEDAWVEAETARKNSEMHLEETKRQAALLRNEFDVFMSASRKLMAKSSAANLPEAQKAEFSHVQRMVSAAHEMVREYTDGYVQGTQETQEKPVSLSVQDVMTSVLTTLTHHQTVVPVWVGAARDVSGEPKIQAQPARLLRATVGTVLIATKASGATNARLDFTITRSETAATCTYSLLFDGSTLETETAWAAFAKNIEEKLGVYWQSIFKTSPIEVSVSKAAETQFELRISLPVALASKGSMKPRKPARQPRRAPN